MIGTESQSGPQRYAVTVRQHDGVVGTWTVTTYGGPDKAGRMVKSGWSDSLPPSQRVAEATVEHLGPCPSHPEGPYAIPDDDIVDPSEW